MQNFILDATSVYVHLSLYIRKLLQIFQPKKAINHKAFARIRPIQAPPPVLGSFLAYQGMNL